MEKAILVGLATNKAEKDEAEESMEELSGLAAAAGAQVVKKVFQNRARISPKYFLGQGKVEELSRLKHEFETDMIIFDHNLSPIQQRSLEDELETKIIDRTQLILDIFAQRARTNEGKLQVELAQLSYRLPRLVGKGLALSQPGAGIGTRGPGEKKLEEDRRRITDRISKIKKDIQSIQMRRSGQRESRKKTPVPTVSLVGYTSAGKSTLFNALTREKRYTSPHLFATLDPVLRRITCPDGLFFFLSDTVGFIKKLPVELISSFQATLEEVKDADVLCHVIDAMSPYSQIQMNAVESLLADIGIPDIPILKVFNKIDLLPDAGKNELLRRNASASGRSLYVSAKTGEGTGELKRRIKDILFHGFNVFSFRIPKERQDMIHSLLQRSFLLKKRERPDSLEFKVMADPKVVVSYLPFLEQGEENW